jgi:hypothetical protein
MRGEWVRIGNGKKKHRRYDDHYAYCGAGPVDNGKDTKGMKPCRTCEELYLKDRYIMLG